MNEETLVEPSGAKRLSMWLMTAAMVLVIGLKSYGPPVAGIPWHIFGWPLLVAGVVVARLRVAGDSWWKTTVLLSYLIGLLFVTRIDGDTTNGHVLELALMLGVGILLVPALLAKYWLREPLDYSWFNGRWTPKM